jgi:hypothetical protein
MTVNGRRAKMGCNEKKGFLLQPVTDGGRPTLHSVAARQARNRIEDVASGEGRILLVRSRHANVRRCRPRLVPSVILRPQ